MLRVYLDAERLANVRFMTDPAPLDEILMSLRMLRGGPHSGTWGRWRRHTRQRLPEPALPLLDLIPGRACPPALPGLLAPDLDGALELLASAPANQLHAEFAAAFASRRMPPWVHRLAQGDRAARHGLISGLRVYYQTCLVPHETAIRTAVDADVVRRSLMIRDGLGTLLSAIHPAMGWQPPYLEVDGNATGSLTTLVPSGHVLLRPAAFCVRLHVRTIPHRTLIIAYPVWTPTHTAAPENSEPDSLSALLGATRAALLRTLRDAVHTTTELARRLRISPATVSEHTTILRRTGLITTTRRGPSVHHHITPLGQQLIHARGVLR